MVDLTSDFSTTNINALVDTSALRLRTITNRVEAISYVDQLNPDVIATGYQNPTFLRAWLTQLDATPYFLIFSQKGHGDVLLPLEISAKGVATYCGGTHANGNFPVGLKQDIQALTPDIIINMVGLLANQELVPSVVFLERQHTQWQGCANPFVNAKSSQSANVALSLSLEGGFGHVLDQHNSKRKRKRQRAHMRKLEELGTVEIQQHVPCNQVKEVLQAFFEMKAVRFKEAGICDVFADQSIKDMFAQMFMESCAQTNPTHVLKAVRLNGKPISVIGCTILNGRLTVEFGAFDETYAAGGPGDLLFYLAVENACEQGLDIFDFGIGDEFYKRSWCDIETWHHDTIIGVTPAGKAIGLLKQTRNAVVFAIKTNNVIWATTKQIENIWLAFKGVFDFHPERFQDAKI
ncbi:MAG: GNAT family N-acetyltransferase [Ahrensia sp.]|nr:GNAT family N-acetyltransferase [Ahrensia sp.]